MSSAIPLTLRTTLATRLSNIYSCLSASQRAEQPKRTYPSRQLNDNRDRSRSLPPLIARQHQPARCQGSSKATQNPTQHLHVSARTDLQGTSGADEKTLLLPVHAPGCESVRAERGVGDTGFEPGPSFPQKTSLLKQGNAQYNALFGDDERLRLLREAWAELLESVKTAVLEMVRG